MVPVAFRFRLNANVEILQIIDFLVVFPPQSQALELVRSNNSSEKDMFPLQRPFKALYSLNTLSMCLHEEAVEVSLIALVLDDLHANGCDRFLLIKLLCFTAFKCWLHS